MLTLVSVHFVLQQHSCCSISKNSCRRVAYVPTRCLGVWIMIACWHTKSLIPQWLKWLGIIVWHWSGTCQYIPSGYPIFVDKVILHIPPPSDEVIEKIPVNIPANIFLHQIVWIGSFMSVLTLPIWTILTSARL